ncbi:hypothetical protein [Streptomyces poonensis]|uniref:Uncharacterized protein n=1 Tax=Streptomyces poonensis TaxID=68255 RepID=A0A918UBU8_9ACTN|nr:hypothetical protein [Streptomyces poonensis]GGY89007.1 hypothetical protein GCM10010365_03880 [Streptomyces poonensis]GLJ88176.1 hypothetical protein GCM10017589_07760 [Streptomyces poonensis]
MVTEGPLGSTRAQGGPAPGALLLCRAAVGSAVLAARLLREEVLLTSAGPEWTVLVPEGRPWSYGDEPVDRVVSGWAEALFAGAPSPVLALWWDAGRCGCVLASGLRRTVGYGWLADGTPVGEDGTMETFAARLGLDPVLDVQSLESLTRSDSEADGRTRVLGLLAVLTRAGVSLPAGLAPGEPAGRLREAVLARSDVRQIEWPDRQGAVRAEPGDVERTRPGPWPPTTGGPQARALAAAQLAAGLPLTAWGVRRGSAGWTVAGALLLAHGALGLAYDRTRGAVD